MANSSYLDVLPDSNSSYSDYAMEWANGTQPPLPGAASPAARSTTTRTATIAKCAILLPVVFIGVVGNIMTLIAIRTTPRLWTKTNFFLASMAVTDVLVAVTLVYYTVYQLVVYIFATPCRFIRMIAVITPIQTIPLYVSCAHLALLAVDRYVAIVYPLHYELHMTTAVTGILVAVAWVVPALMSLLQMFWLLRVDWNSCLAPYSVAVQFALSLALYAFVSIVMIGAYSRIFKIVLGHRAKINAAAAAYSAARQSTSTVDGGQGTLTEASKTAASKKTEFKAAKMVSVVLLSFIILWFPNILGKAFQAVGRKDSFAQYLLDIGIGLGSVNNSLNWVIYGVMNQDFRNAFRRLLPKCRKS